MEELRSILNKYSLDMIVIPSHKNPNFIRFTKIKADYSYLIVENEDYILTSEFDKNLFSRKFKIVKGKLLEKIKNKVIGMDIKNLPYYFVNYLEKYCKIIDISEEIEQIRMKKTKEEIENIKKAIRITEKVLELIYQIDVKKFTELELKYYLIKEGCNYLVSPAFEVLVAFDENAINPHPISGNRKPKKAILIDIGFKYNYYVSDITRTFILDQKLKNLYEKVLNVQEECIDMVKEGIKFSEIQDFADKKLNMIHGIGHGIGLEVHERPTLKDYLIENSVITIEPGYYKKVGIRIEDDILVKKDKREILSKFPKQFDEILL